MNKREFELAIDLANYILNDTKELVDFMTCPSRDHVYIKALLIIYDEEQALQMIKDECSQECVELFESMMKKTEGE